MLYTIFTLLLIAGANAQFFNNFFGGGQQQQQQHQQKPFEDQILNDDCKGYLCADTRTCVEKPLDCPCPYTRSQLKCILPDKKNYVCISKPATLNEKLIEQYDDPVKGPKLAIDGLRDCGWVTKAYNGLV